MALWAVCPVLLHMASDCRGLQCYRMSGHGFLSLDPAFIIGSFQQFGKFCNLISLNTALPAFSLLVYSGMFSYYPS